MKKVVFFICCLLCFCPFLIKAMEVNVDKRESIGGSGTDVFNSTISTPDGGYVAVGYTDSEDFDDLTNIGYEDGLIVKFDKSGNVEWKRVFGGTDDEKFNDVALTNDGGYVVVGDTVSADIEDFPELDTYAGLIVKYSKDGELVSKHFFDFANSDHFESVVTLDDGSLVVVGYFDFPGEEDFEDILSPDFVPSENVNDYFNSFIVKLSSDFQPQWIDALTGNGDDYYTSVSMDKNGDFIVIGNTDSTDIEGLDVKGNSDSIIVKYSKDGELVWRKIWGGNGYDYFNSFVEDGAGNFIVVGNTDSTDITNIANTDDNFKSVLIKYNKEGNIIFEKTFDGNNNHSYHDVLLTANDSFVVVGQLDSDNIDSMPNKGYNDALIVGYDKDGKLLWKSSFGGDGFDSFDYIVMNEDGKYFVSGNTDSEDLENIPNKGYEDILLNSYLVNYDVVSSDSEQGTYTVSQRGSEGVVLVTPKRGYEVKEVIVKRSDNTSLEVTKLEDDTYVFPLYDDVSVEVLFVEILVNPKTGVKSMIGVVFTFMLIAISAFFMIKNCNNSYEL